MTRKKAKRSKPNTQKRQNRVDYILKRRYHSIQMLNAYYIELNVEVGLLHTDKHRSTVNDI